MSQPTRLEIRRAYEKMRRNSNLPVVCGAAEETAIDMAMANMNRENDLRLATVLLATWRREYGADLPDGSPKEAA